MAGFSISMAKCYLRKTLRNGGTLMKRFGIMILTLAVLLSLSACSEKEEAFTPDYDSAIGVIFVNNSQPLPEKEKVYADYADHSYSFNLDAACIYYFNASAEEAYAGDQNLTYLTFSADLDENTVGAEGEAAYHLEEESDNSVTAYYLYHDEDGVYFDTETYFDTFEVTEGYSVKGIDYPSLVSFTLTEPAVSFTIKEYDAAHKILSEKEYTPDEVTDYQTFKLRSDTASVEVTSIAANGTEMDTQTISPENYTAAICFDTGGQILGSKILRFDWEE